MQGSNNRFTADNENLVLNGSGREGKFRLLRSVVKHTHTSRGSPSFYTKRKNNQNRFTFMVNDAYGHSGPGPWKSRWETHHTNRMIHIISSLYWKGSTLNIPLRHHRGGNPHGQSDLTVHVA